MGVFQLATSPASILAGLLAGGVIGASARRSSARMQGADVDAAIMSGDGRPATAPDTPADWLTVTRVSPSAGPILSRHRSGRLSLPESVANLTPADEPALLLANVFLDHLADLPLSQWLSVGGRLVANRDTLPSRSMAWAIMDASIAHHRLGCAAWNVRDAVETIAFLKSHSGRRLSRSERRLFVAAHGAAEDATLATLAREHLSPRDFAILCAPFAESIGVAADHGAETGG